MSKPSSRSVSQTLLTGTVDKMDARDSELQANNIYIYFFRKQQFGHREAGSNSYEISFLSNKTSCTLVLLSQTAV